jgi:hypothetical protein
VYDPITDTWSCAAPMLTPRSAPAGVLYHALILVLGGELAPNSYGENEGYEFGKWVKLGPTPEGRHNVGSGVIGSDAYFVGGSLKPRGRRTDEPAHRVYPAMIGPRVS